MSSSTAPPSPADLSPSAPTEPATPGPASTPSIHAAAAAGYSAGADTYVKGRPDYPPELHAWLRDSVGIVPGAAVVDLGAGTGKFTQLLAKTGADVIAVEPVAEMLARLRVDLPGVTGVQGTATAIPLPDASADVVVCAQAFHWFATTAALDEMARVLKPGGRLALIWNLRDAHVPWVARMNEITDRHEGDVPRFYKGTWRGVFPHPAFEAPSESQFTNAHTGPAEDVIVKRVLSTSFISALPDDQRATVEAQLRRLIDETPDLKDPPHVAVPYLTFAFCARKRG
ncbi:SAM-dependent methyltransferase [Roseateles aquatilis]|uniref:SAM-dependent methyltransferase n=1 Tax=Roseateles aquatilis TaxID=431061 RepID=A0A246JCS0_9BURK|nr:class I SAM-dependent methyltransferase [Roseateles aquatilis]OWQ90360.1 SAM-dependent methyltransferase [Roseateles aquatilis]